MCGVCLLLETARTDRNTALLLLPGCTRYNVDPQLVARVLSIVCLPDIVEGAAPGGVTAFAEYPPWFQRRS